MLHVKMDNTNAGYMDYLPPNERIFGVNKLTMRF